MGRIGFEPMKAEPTDLQSVPFNHSGTDPIYKHIIRSKIKSCKLFKKNFYNNIKPHIELEPDVW